MADHLGACHLPDGARSGAQRRALVRGNGSGRLPLEMLGLRQTAVLSAATKQLLQLPLQTLRSGRGPLQVGQERSLCRDRHASRHGQAQAARPRDQDDGQGRVQEAGSPAGRTPAAHQPLSAHHRRKRVRVGQGHRHQRGVDPLHQQGRLRLCRSRTQGLGYQRAIQPVQGIRGQTGRCRNR